MKYNLPSLKDLLSVVGTNNDAINYLISKEIIMTSISCKNCGRTVNLNIEKRYYRCSKYDCRTKVSIFYKSFFLNSKVDVSILLQFGYFFLSKASHTQIMTYTGLTEKTVTSYLKYFRELLADSLDEEQIIIGGDGVLVQVDETKLGKRKYNRGHRVEGVWVIGGVELTEERKVFLKIIETRDSETISNVLLNYVSVGSTLITDCWRGYVDLQRLGYHHQTVNHSQTFVDPISGACTNTIEGTWNALKMQIASRNRTINCENNLW